jgi:hypothetical protein
VPRPPTSSGQHSPKRRSRATKFKGGLAQQVAETLAVNDPGDVSVVPRFTGCAPGAETSRLSVRPPEGIYEVSAKGGEWLTTGRVRGSLQRPPSFSPMVSSS